MSYPKKKPWFREHDGWWYVTRRVDGKRVQTKLVRGKENEAEAYESFYSLMASSGHAEPSRTVTLNELAARFLAYCERERSAATLRWYVNFLDSFDKHYEGRIDDLKRSHIDAWLAEHPDWSKTSRRHAITVIKRLINWAFEEGHIGEVPTGLRKLKRPAGSKRDTIVSEENHKRMLEASDTAFCQVLTALWETGARPKEIREVTSEMIILEAGVWLLKEHKTVEATQKPRIIYLTETMKELSAELIKQNPTGPIFRNSKGQPWTMNAIRLRMKRLRERLSLPKGTVAYAYRHTYATNGLKNGVQIAEMTELLGHSNSKMLSEHYGHLSQKTAHMRDVAQRASRASE